MLKETITCLVIIITIFIFDNRTQAYTSQSVRQTVNSLENLKKEVSEENKDNEKMKKNINEIYDEWMQFHDKLAFYIEHDELEKVETEMVGVKGNIEIEEYETVVSEIDKCIFILEHIEDKYKFSLANRF